MATPIATISGTMLVPGVSKNRRLYTPELIYKTVTRMRERIADPNGLPIVMRTHHDAGDNSTLIVGRITSAATDETGAVKYTADLYDTTAGRDIAALTDGNKPALRSTSIHGYWLGPVKRITHNGETVETGNDIEIDAVDFTASPGVPGAVLDLTPTRPRESVTDRTPISESYEARITEVTDTNIEEKGAPALKSGKAAAAPTPGASAYADPGYQDDKAKRYPLDTKAHAKAAWSYIQMPRNASQYTAPQLKQIKNRIMKALRKFGVKVDAKEGWAITSGELTETTITELYDAMNTTAGSFCVSLCNGPITVTVSSYCVDPADLDMVGTAAMTGACQALAALDPDWDGDVDIDAAPDRPDGDTDTGGTETAPTQGTATETCPDHPAGDSTTTTQEVLAVSEATTQAADTTAAPTPTRTLTEADITALGAVFSAALKENAPPTPPAVASETAPPVTESTPKVTETEALKESLRTELTAAVTAAVAAERIKVRDELREEFLRDNGIPPRRGYRVHENDQQDPTPEVLYEDRANILLGAFGKTPVPAAGTGTAPEPTTTAS